MRRLGFALIGLAVLAAACGGSDSTDKYQGAASAAVAQFFNEENAGALLPEGIGPVTSTGIAVGNIHRLEVDGQQKKDDVKARYCIEYPYQRPPTEPKRRVYLAQLVGDAWDVEAVNPDGSCEGVS
ncbi:MAG TPA: hypothetical protein VIH21_04725 [Dehalococcoidia bacterium]